MYHLGFLLVLAWINFSADVDISNVPLGQLTIAMIGEKLLSYARVIGAVWLLYRSLENDKIWPWRWNRFFILDWGVSIVVFCLAIWIGLGAKKNQEITILACIVLGILGYMYFLYKAGFQNAAKDYALKLMTYDKSRFPEGFDDHAAKTCIDIYVDEKFSATGLPPEGVCSVDTGKGWSFEVDFSRPKLLQVLRECIV